MRKLLLLYMPVIHQGYMNFLKEYHRQDIECVLLGREALHVLKKDMPYVLKKDFAIRGVDTEHVRFFIRETFRVFKDVYVLDPHHLPKGVESIYTPDEDVTNLAIETFFPGTLRVMDGCIRLRYDRQGVERVDPVPEDTKVTSDVLYRLFMQDAEEEAGYSFDFWLQVGAVARTKTGERLYASYNRAEPHEQIHTALGDPRALYTRGERTDDTLVHHAERSIVSQAACDGVSLRGASVFVTHFPCVPCASALAEAGIARLYFKQGYSRLESANVLKTYGVELIRVE